MEAKFKKGGKTKSLMTLYQRLIVVNNMKGLGLRKFGGELQ